MKKIDAHAHVGYFGGWSDVGITPEKMLQEMDKYKIERTIISYPNNIEVQTAVEKYPENLIGLVWVNPNEGNKAVEQAYHYVRNCGFKGIKLHPLFNAFVANDEIVYPIAKVAEE